MLIYTKCYFFKKTLFWARQKIAKKYINKISLKLTFMKKSLTKAIFETQNLHCFINREENLFIVGPEELTQKIKISLNLAYKNTLKIIKNIL